MDPLADDSADEKRLKRDQKDTKKEREERIRLRKVRMPRRNFQYSNRTYQPIPGFSECSNAYHLSAVGDAKVMATVPNSVEFPYHPIQFRSKEHLDQEPMVKNPCNHEFIDSHEGKNECELDVKVQNVEDFEQLNLFDEHISVSELNNSHANVKRRVKENVTFWEQIGANPWILNILREGYFLPFVELPPKVIFKNNNSAVKSEEL